MKEVLSLQDYWNTKMMFLRRLPWSIVVVAIFGVVYARALTLVYVEGDDATSIAYHSFDRNATLQPPYSAYQSGADLLLSLLPAKEPVLRVVSILLTSVAMVGCALLMLALAFDFLRDVRVAPKWLVSLVVVLAIPELFYLGLVYQPPVIGMCLILTSHLVLRRALREQEATGTWGLSFILKATLAAALLGAGGAVRWNLVVYGWLMLWDWVLGVGRRPADGWRDYVGRAAIASIWGGAAASAWLLALAASGYGPRDVFAFQRFAMDVATNEREWRILIAQNLSLFTPVAALLIPWGIVSLFRHHRRLVVLAVIATLPVLPLIAWAGPKQYLWFFPTLVVCLTAGCSACFLDTNRLRWRGAVFAGVAALLLLPWVVGVRATQGDTAWGPGFETRPYDREKRPEARPSLTLGAGAAVPTSEGPRPLWGHGAVLLGGHWRRFCLAAAEERNWVVQAALRERLPILVLQGGTGVIIGELNRLGFATLDSDDRQTGAFTSSRRFSSREGKEVVLLRSFSELPKVIGNASSIQRLITEAENDQVVATGYPANLRALYNALPAAMRKIGPGAAIVSLSRYHAHAVERSRLPPGFE